MAAVAVAATATADAKPPHSTQIDQTSTVSSSPDPPPPKPSHPNLIKVIRNSEPYGSYAISVTSLPPGAHFTTLIPSPTNPITSAAVCDYTTVQSSALPHPTHISLNSDLVYCNHSCDPSLIFDMDKQEVRVVGHRALSEGDRLTFFYPSTEWEMRQPFQCRCGFTGPESTTKTGGNATDIDAGDQDGHLDRTGCLGWIGGAKFLPNSILKQYWINKHILDLTEHHAQEEDVDKDGSSGAEIGKHRQ